LLRGWGRPPGSAQAASATLACPYTFFLLLLLVLLLLLLLLSPHP
jgi:hypothetical protein